jgi:catechol 2,3-dioxygenase-like lactoylglutathione lyase family enzyme
MVKHFDHLTIVVRDVERAKEFFGLLGFKEAKSVVIAGEPFASYMGVPDILAPWSRRFRTSRRPAYDWDG